MASQIKPFPVKVALVQYFYHTSKKSNHDMGKVSIAQKYENIPKQLSQCSNVSHH